MQNCICAITYEGGGGYPRVMQGWWPQVFVGRVVDAMLNDRKHNIDNHTKILQHEFEMLQDRVPQAKIGNLYRRTREGVQQMMIVGGAFKFFS